MATSALLTARETAERLRLGVTTVYDLVNSGQLQAYRLGRGKHAVRISEEAIAAYLEASQTPREAPMLLERRHLRPPGEPRRQHLRAKPAE